MIMYNKNDKNNTIIYNGVYKNNSIVITYNNDLISMMSSNINNNEIYNYFINEVENELTAHGISFQIKKKFVETIENKKI